MTRLRSHAFSLAASSLLTALCAAPLLAFPNGGEPATKSDAIRSFLHSFENTMTCGVSCGEACMEAGQCTPDCKATYATKSALLGDVQRDPELRAALLQALSEGIRCSETKPEVKARMLDFLAESQCAEGRELASRLYTSSPELFSVDQMLAFAMGGAEVFVQAAPKAYAEAQDAGQKLLLAVFLAGKKDASGRKTLESALADPLADAGALARAFLASNALAKLGVKALDTGRLAELALEEALAALDRGDVDRARRLALETRLGRQSIDGSWVQLPYFEQRLEWALGFGEHEYADATKVFALIESMDRASS